MRKLKVHFMTLEVTPCSLPPMVIPHVCCPLHWRGSDGVLPEKLRNGYLRLIDMIEYYSPQKRFPLDHCHQWRHKLFCLWSCFIWAWAYQWSSNISICHEKQSFRGDPRRNFEGEFNIHFKRKISGIQVSWYWICSEYARVKEYVLVPQKWRNCFGLSNGMTASKLSCLVCIHDIGIIVLHARRADRAHHASFASNKLWHLKSLYTDWVMHSHCPINYVDLCV